MKNNKLIAAFVWCCFTHVCLADQVQRTTRSAKPVKPVFTPYPATPQALKSDTYQMKINGQEVFVEKLARFDVPVHYARLEYSGKQPLKIEVFTAKAINTCRISPLKNNIVAKKTANKLSFSLSVPKYLAIQIDSLEYLFLLIDKPETNKISLPDIRVKNILDYGVDKTGSRLETVTLQQAIDEASSDTEKKVLYFPPGEYRTGELKIKSNVSIYLDAGAIIKGSNKRMDYKESLLRFDHAKQVRIMGRGTIDGSGWDGLRRDGGKEIYLLYLSGCEDVLIDGPVLRDPCFWNTRVYTSKGIHLRNLKIINNCPKQNWTNTDGVDFDSSVDCNLVNAIMHTGDDNMVVKGLDTTGNYNTQQISFEDVIGISNSAAAKIGTETCVKQFQHIQFRNIDIVRCKRAFVISGYDSSAINDVQVVGMRVEQVVNQGKEKPRIIDIEVTDKSWRECTGRCSISNIVLRNIVTCFPLDNVESQIIGRTNSFGVRQVVIDGFRSQNKLINSCKAGNIRLNDFVSQLTFK